MYKLEKTEPFSGVQLEMEGRKFYWRAIDISDETFVKRNSERPDKIILDIHYDDLAKIHMSKSKPEDMLTSQLQHFNVGKILSNS